MTAKGEGRQEGTGANCAIRGGEDNTGDSKDDTKKSPEKERVDRAPSLWPNEGGNGRYQAGPNPKRGHELGGMRARPHRPSAEASSAGSIHAGCLNHDRDTGKDPAEEDHVPHRRPE